MDSLLSFSLLSPVIGLTIITAIGTWTKPAQAHDVGILLAIADDGDDRPRPAAGAHVGVDQNYYARAWFWGQTFGPVTDTKYLVAAGRRINIFGQKGLTAGFGGAGLLEKTEIAYEDEPSENDSESRYNLGVIIGMYYDYDLHKNMKILSSWESHLFGAGTGTLFLSTARKQTLGVGLGVSF